MVCTGDPFMRGGWMLTVLCCQVWLRVLALVATRQTPGRTKTQWASCLRASTSPMRLARLLAGNCLPRGGGARAPCLLAALDGYSLSSVAASCLGLVRGSAHLRA